MPETLITLAIIGAMFAWPPLLQWICPPCSRFFNSRRQNPVDSGREGSFGKNRAA